MDKKKDYRAELNRSNSDQGDDSAHQALAASTYIDSLSARGLNTFTRTEALAALNVSPAAFKRAVARLKRQGRVTAVKRDFYVIVAPEFRKSGGPAPSWYIDPLMRHIGQLYYVGILSAAALYGSAHQQPQEFQVVTDKPQRRIDVPREAPCTRIVFFLKTNIESRLVRQIKVPTGYFNISSPEVTAYDLVNYYRAAGGLSRALAVLGGLADNLDKQRLKGLLDIKSKMAPLQRLGYMLDFLGYADLTELLHFKLRALETAPVPLVPSGSRKGSQRDHKWNLYINSRLKAEQ